MTLLIASADEEAALAVQASLTRARRTSIWATSLGDALSTVVSSRPVVCVTDSAFPEYLTLLEFVRRESPWARLYVMADPASPPPANFDVPQVQKPFDAAEFADLLVREEELAELDRTKRDLETHVDELALLVQECFEAIVGLDAQGRIRSWNPGAARLYGYTEAEALGRSATLLELEDSLVTARLARGERQVFETSRKHKDGRTVEVLLSLSRIPEHTQSRFHFVEVSLDIGEHRRLKRTLEHSERLAAIGRIAASMAHEINNPLAVIQASTLYLSDIAEQENATELSECASDLKIAAERIQSFVQHICGFARRERPEFSDVSLDQAIEMALRLVRPRARARKIEVVVAERTEVPVPHDPPRVSQAILNLLSNAVDAASRRVTLSTRVVGSEVLIEVDDDGSGIEEAFLANAFEPFQTTKPHGQGTGLGLAITRQIVEEHGGSVTLARRAQGGTRALLRLWLFDPKRHKIVVLTESDSAREALSQVVEQAGFSVGLPQSGEQAEAELARGTSLVVVDGPCFGKSPGELLTWVLERCPKAARLVISDGPPKALPRDVAALQTSWNAESLVATLRKLCIVQEQRASS